MKVNGNKLIDLNNNLLVIIRHSKLIFYKLMEKTNLITQNIINGLQQVLKVDL